MVDILNFVGWGGHIYDLKLFTCVWNRLASQSYTIFFPVIVIILPCCCVFVCYFKIYLVVRKSKNRIRDLAGKLCKSKTESKDSIRLAKSLFMGFFLFVLCT